MHAKKLLIPPARFGLIPAGGRGQLCVANLAPHHHLQQRRCHPGVGRSRLHSTVPEPSCGAVYFPLIGAGTLEVVDASFDGDSIAVFNIALNNTRTQIGFQQGSIFSGAHCGPVPADCLANNQFARLSVALAGATPGKLQFAAPDAPLIQSSAFFRITGTIDRGTTVSPPPPLPPTTGNPVPEPSRCALTGVAFALPGWFRHRKRRTPSLRA